MYQWDKTKTLYLCYILYFTKPNHSFYTSGTIIRQNNYELIWSAKNVSVISALFRGVSIKIGSHFKCG